MRHKWLILFVVCLLSCGEKGVINGLREFQEIEEGGVAVHFMQLPENRRDETSMACKLRVLLDKNKFDDASKKMRTAYWYEIDSVFYIKIGERKIYPEMQEAVNSGIMDGFEYFLLFDLSQLKGYKDIRFVFDDKHLTNKRYSLQLN